MSPKQELHFRQMYNALKRIARYDSPDRLRRTSEKQWGVGFDEAIEMAYDNIQGEAKAGLVGVRLPKSPEEQR